MRRWYTLVVLAVFLPNWVDAQIYSRGLASGEYNPYKYSLAFADQAQMVYDGSRLTQKINMGMLDVADLAYYNGHYINAAGRYLGLGSLPKKKNRFGDELSHMALSKIIFDIDIQQVGDEDLKQFTAGVNTVGMLFHTRGKYVIAEQILQFCLTLRGNRFGKTSREYLNSLANMAVLKKDLGLYEESERMFNYLVPVFKKLYSPNSVQYVVVINNKAMLLAALGRTKEAIALMDEALQYGQTAFQPGYFDYERVLTNRALIEQESGSLQTAESLYKQAIAGMEKKGFEDHPDYNNVLVNYGSLLVQKGDRGVLTFLTEIADKVEKRYSENHPVTAKAFSNQGQYYLSAGDFANALPIFQRVAGIQLKLFGDKHKDYLNTLVKIGVCQWQLNDAAGATAQFKKAIQNYMYLLGRLFPSMSEFEKAKFWMSLKPSIDTYMAFVLDKKQNHLYADVYNLQLQTKGLLITSTNRTKSTILESKDSTTLQLYADWLSAKNMLATYYGSTVEDVNEDKVDLVKLEEEANALEKKLSARSAQFSAAFVQKEVVFADVAGALQPGEAALEIVRASYQYGSRKGEVEYVGFVVKGGRTEPELVRLSDGKMLEKGSLVFYKNSIKIKLPDEKSYDAYWKPFEQSLAGIKTVYVSVDGVYNSINLNTLLRKDNSYVIDHENIVIIPNSKLIATGLLKEVDLKKGKSAAMLIGSPAFGNDEVVPSLPGTKLEVENISELLSRHSVATNVLTGPEATEKTVKTIVDPSLLHIATHGYFLSDVNLSAGMTRGVQVSKAKENPLLRSGLLLAGASAAFSAEPTLGGGDNGLLNAYEIMNLDLSDTRVVIMSACETGTGEIVNGEGVYGLTRAFQVAGSKKIIMSLWKVDDAATAQLMTIFYENWVNSNNPQEAFLLAQRSVKKSFPEPYYWGAFILVN